MSTHTIFALQTLVIFTLFGGVFDEVTSLKVELFRVILGMLTNET